MMYGIINSYATSPYLLTDTFAWAERMLWANRRAHPEMVWRIVQQCPDCDGWYDRKEPQHDH